MMFVHKRSDEGAAATLVHHLVQFALAALKRMVIGLSILFSLMYVCVSKNMIFYLFL